MDNGVFSIKTGLSVWFFTVVITSLIGVIMIYIFDKNIPPYVVAIINIALSFIFVVAGFLFLGKMSNRRPKLRRRELISEIRNTDRPNPETVQIYINGKKVNEFVFGAFTWKELIQNLLREHLRDTGTQFYRFFEKYYFVDIVTNTVIASPQDDKLEQRLDYDKMCEIRNGQILVLRKVKPGLT
ncbi:MAG: hypothetical protein ABSB22_12830 [Thermodesulfobacteriota bacterium]